MNIADLSMKTSFRERMLSRLKKFTRKHKYFTIPAVAITVVILTVYNICLYFYSNSKRFTCLASVLFFFIASSSFSYPSLSLNVSFVSNSNIDEREYDAVSSNDILPADAISDTVVLAKVEEVDPALSASPEKSQIDDIDLEGEGAVIETYSLEDFVVNTENSDTDESDTDSESGKTFSKDDWKLILVNKQHPIPDDYEFLGAMTDAYKMIGNAVPPEFARRLALSVYELLFE